MWNFKNSDFIKGKHGLPCKIEWGAIQSRKGRKSGDFGPSVDQHLVPDLHDLFFFPLYCFRFQFRPNFLLILTSFFFSWSLSSTN